MSARSLHHVTAIAGPAQRNLDFYTRTLGLRLVKKTVNFDDPGTYHFYYGDGAGAPGTILTFFPWEHAAPGRAGVGETLETSFRVPERALGYWVQRFVENGVSQEAPELRFGDKVLTFRDPDGTRLALVARPGAETEPAWSDGAVPEEHAIRGFHGVSLLLRDAAPTAAILEDIFGFSASDRDGALARYRIPEAAYGGVVDLRAAGDFVRGRPGAGSVHHIAFRAAGDADQAEMVRRLADHHGIRTTEQKDRNYFRSVYFREPGGVLFEIATDDPGFAVDEPVETLGAALQLPPGLERERAHIEAILPAIA